MGGWFLRSGFVSREGAKARRARGARSLSFEFKFKLKVEDCGFLRGFVASREIFGLSGLKSGFFGHELHEFFTN